MTENIPATGVSRRKFMAWAGSAAGFAAMAAMGISAKQGGFSANIPEIDIDSIAYAECEADILVVGSGIAGLFAAVKGHDAGVRMLMVSKERLGCSGQTPFAKGFFAYDPAREKLSLGAFVDTVSRSAMGTNNPVYTRQMAHETANMIINAEMKLRASIMRKESRCSHFRLDYPEMDNRNWNAWINIYKGRDGSM